MQTFDSVGGLVHELCDQTAVVDRVILLHSALDGDTFFVYDDDT